MVKQWEEQMAADCPALKVMCYWGDMNIRAGLRRWWLKRSRHFNRHCDFDVVLTTFAVFREDLRFFAKKSMPWQCVVLDAPGGHPEWSAALRVKCRSRVLLTTDPVTPERCRMLMFFVLPGTAQPLRSTCGGVVCCGHA